MSLQSAFPSAVPGIHGAQPPAALKWSGGQGRGEDDGGGKMGRFKPPMGAEHLCQAPELQLIWALPQACERHIISSIVQMKLRLTEAK